MYFPEAYRTLPAAAGLAGVDEVILEPLDGNRIVCWWSPPRPGQPTLLYFHGNGGSLAVRAERVRRYQSLGRGMFMMSYRGYSGSTGVPSEVANVTDAIAAYERLRALGVAPVDIIVYGESLGSGVAVQLAAQRSIGGLILDAPYTSTVDVAASVYPYLPVRWLMRDRYESARHIFTVSAPLLVIHGERDRVIPVEMGRRLFDAAPGRKDFIAFPHAGHDDHHLHGSYAAINGWIDRLRAERPPG